MNTKSFISSEGEVANEVVEMLWGSMVNEGDVEGEVPAFELELDPWMGIPAIDVLFFPEFVEREEEDSDESSSDFIELVANEAEFDLE